MADVMTDLRRSDRRLVERLADDAGVPVSAMLPAIVAAYLALLRDAPAALPNDPMRGLSSAALKHAKGA